MQDSAVMVRILDIQGPPEILAPVSTYLRLGRSQGASLDVGSPPRDAVGQPAYLAHYLRVMSRDIVTAAE